jgi:hypothetical protein
MNNLLKSAALTALAVSWHCGAMAAPIVRSSYGYDMLNGEQAGSFLLVDSIYSGTGCATCPLDALSDGAGKLNDGVIATGNWSATPDPYVGWASIDPVILFYFGPNVPINRVTLYVDGESLPFSPPASVRIGTTTYTIPDPHSSAPLTLSFDGLGLNVGFLEIQLFRRSQWIGLSEVEFDDGSIVTPPPPPAQGVPEPVTIGLFAAGLVSIGALRQRP